ncbi:MAG: rhomboid family intramembrane serine protease [Bacteroidia bacterium]|nr:rhomboid family intramembrane serine protease [Bacteroidia bacterium]MDW8346785.1 rhomboid family intramembrane serine protease [Bacteroidia bacterium]
MNIRKEIRLFLSMGSRAVNQIIVINTAIFLVTGILYVVFFLFNKLEVYRYYVKFLELPASLPQLLRQPWTLFTYMFLHAGIFHILFNMLWLYWLGKSLSEYQGEAKVWYTYIFGGLFGGIMFITAYNIFPVFKPIVAHSYAVGASAGVMAILTALATLIPNQRIVLFLFGEIKMKWFALIVFMIDFLMIGSSNSGGHIAHTGGAVWGFFYMILLKKGIDVYLPFQRLFIRLGQYRKKKKTMRIVHSAYSVEYQSKGTSIAERIEKIHVTTKDENEIPTQEEIDRILDKILEKGMNSLTKKEKETLARYKDV